MKKNTLEPENFSRLVSNVFDGIKMVDAEHSMRVVSLWQDIIESLTGQGSDLSVHSRTIELKNGVLLVEADHSGCLTLLQMYKRSIINALKRRAPELGVRNLVYRLKGTDATLYKVQTVSPPVEAILEELRRRQEKEDALLAEWENRPKQNPIDYETMIALPEFQKKIAETEAELEVFRARENESKKRKGYLPPDLRAKFEELEKIVLTNSKNK